MSHTNRAIRSVFKSRAHMEVLVVVADTGSMSAAAKALHTTQPVVTKVIKISRRRPVPHFSSAGAATAASLRRSAPTPWLWLGLCSTT